MSTLKRKDLNNIGKAATSALKISDLVNLLFTGVEIDEEHQECAQFILEWVLDPSDYEPE